jgi:hypothetical protein
VLDRVAAGDDRQSGEWGGYSWQLDREPYGARDPLDRTPLEQVTVMVRGEKPTPLATLTTIRIRS